MTIEEKIEEAKELCSSKKNSYKNLSKARKILEALFTGEIDESEKSTAECLLKILNWWNDYIFYGLVPAALGEGSRLYDKRIKEYEQKICSEIKKCK